MAQVNAALSVALRLRHVVVRGLEAVLIAGFAVLTLDVLWGVISRYVLGEQSQWTEELAIYLLVWVSLLGGSLTYAEKGHLGVDYFVGLMDPAAQKVTAVIVELLVSGFAIVGLCYGGFVLVWETLKSKQLSPALGIEMGYMYLAVPICGVFLLLFSLEHLYQLLTSDSGGAGASQASPLEGES